MQYRRLLDESFKNLLVVRSSPWNFSNRRGFISAYWTKFERWQSRVKKAEKEEREEKYPRAYFPGGIYLTPENPQAMILAKIHPLDQTTTDQGGIGYDLAARHFLLRYIDWSPANINRYKRYQEMISRQYDQRFIAERHLMLGSDLAAAHFLLHRGGAVKFLGDDNWHKQDEKGQYKLPGGRVSGLQIEAIDASGTEIMFEGLDNLVDLRKLRYLNLSNCKYVNDWCLSKMPQFEGTLEFLDLSYSRNITAKGLSGVACLKRLKYLRLEGFDKVKDVAKVVIQLEEKIPGLQVVGLDYDAAIDALEKEQQLLSHANVVQDARGNLFAKDSTGELYYLYGDLTERQVLDDNDDLPMIVSKIRKDPPALPLETNEELNRLSDGKLKHLLAGSPSGEWSQETERVLEMDAKKLLDKGHAVHPFVVPENKSKLKRQLEKLKLEEETRFLEAKEELRLGAGPG